MTVEPVIALYLISVGLNQVTRPNLLLEKACLKKLDWQKDVCDEVIYDNANETMLGQIQQEVSNYESNLNFAAFVPRFLYALLAGYWSDKNGRKALIAIPIFGQVLTSLTLLLNSAFVETLPFETLYLEFINEMCGNFIVYYLGIYSYLADVSTNETRTFRISIADGTDYVSTMIGTTISPQLFKIGWFYSVFGLSAVSASMAILYVTFLVKESGLVQNAAAQPTPTNQSYGSTEVLHEEPKGVCQYFDLLSSIKVAIKRRAGIYRTMIFMLIFNFTCYILAYDGTEGTHRYLFATKQYHWNEEQFSYYLSVYRIFYLLTLWIFLPLLSRKLRLHDATVSIISSCTSAIGALLPIIIDSPTGFYLGSIVGSLGPANTIAARSMISKCVEEVEVGRILSLFTLASAISSSVGTAIFQKIYSATLTTFPGFFLLVNAVLYLLAQPNNIVLKYKLV